jgi:hypothetical protein
MLVAAGRFPMAQMLDNFKLMALNRNEIHERNNNFRAPQLAYKHKLRICPMPRFTFSESFIINLKKS